MAGLDPLHVHALAADGPEWYRYVLLDSLSITPARGGATRVYLVEAVPRLAEARFGQLVFDQDGTIRRHRSKDDTFGLELLQTFRPIWRMRSMALLVWTTPGRMM